MAIVDEIRKLLSEGKLLVGTKSVKKALNANKVSKIFAMMVGTWYEGLIQGATKSLALGRKALQCEF